MSIRQPFPVAASIAVPLGVTSGGTGTVTQFTQGSIVFAGASGVYTQDNANLFWDDTNNRLGLGTASPLYPLHILNANAPHIFIASNTTNMVTKEAYISAAHYLTAEEPIGFFNSFSDSSENRLWFGGGLSVFNCATEVIFYTAANQTTLTGTAKLTINSSGNVLIRGFTSGTVGLTVRGANSQSANLQEWRNSSDVILAQVSKDGGVIFNEQGADTDCRIEGDTDQNLVFTDASTDRVGIGTATPGSKFEVAGPIATAFSAKTTNYTVLATDSIMSGDCTSGNLTFTLPAAASITGRQYTFKRIDGSANSVIVDGNASETIDGATTYTLATQWQSISIISNGTNWLII